MTHTFRDHNDDEEPWYANSDVKPSPNVVGDFGSRVIGGDPLLGTVLLHLLLHDGEERLDALLFIHISPRHVLALGEREPVILASEVIRGVVLMFVIP